MGTIAAPLLAGFSLAAVVQTLALSPADLRWQDAAFILFLLAAVLFIATVQATFWARQYQTNPVEIAAWLPDAEKPSGREQIGRDLRVHAEGFRFWIGKARVAYAGAVLCLLAGLTVLAVPAASREESSLRWAAVAIGLAAFIIEAVWSVASFAEPRWRWARRLIEPWADGARAS